MENLAADTDFMKNLASGSVSNIITLGLLGLFYVIMKKCNCRHSKCNSACISCESDNIKTQRTKDVNKIRKEISDCEEEV